MANPSDRDAHGPHALDPDLTHPPVEPTTTCCGGAPPAGADACCVRDADVKAAGGTGCGCGSTPIVEPPRAKPQKAEPKKKGCC